VIALELQQPEQLSPSELAARVREETKRYLSGRRGDERYCLELIRRAVANQDVDAAWASLYAQFSPLVYSWLARQERGREALAAEGADEMINRVFFKAWMALLARTQQFASVGAFLSYMRLCANTVMADWRRDSPPEVSREEEESRGAQADGGRAREAGLLGIVEEERAASNDPAAVVMARLAFFELYEIVQDEAQDEEERALIYLSLLCKLPPRTISHRWPTLFPSAEDVYRIKRNVVERLRRNERLRAYVLARDADEEGGRSPASQKPSSPVAEHARDEQGELLAATQRDLVHLLAEHTLLEARRGVARVVEQQTRSIIDAIDVRTFGGVCLKKQVAFCNKERCRRCQEGLGHGPYWYAYTIIGARTVRTYLGKDLSQVEWAGDRPSYRRARTSVAERQQKVTYHLQVSFCGKQNCQRCQEGTGHGPYWYKYSIVNGRTVRAYVGKSCPASDPPALPGAGIPAAQQAASLRAIARYGQTPS
jgi:hypothetical protein